jgi:DNA-binding transcriptional ArsR family regulator
VTGQDPGAAVNEWVNVVRRARMHLTTKSVALLLASYADKHGTSIYPGVALLAAQTGLSYRTVQWHLARLREMGLIEQGSRKELRRGWSVPYRLILAADLLEKIDVPTPAAEKLAAEKITAARRTRRSPDCATSDATTRSPDCAQSGDQAQWDDPTRRNGQPAVQQEPSPPSIGLSIYNQPSIDTAGVDGTRTGSARTREAGARTDFSDREDQAGETLSCRRCGARYTLTTDGRHGHRVVFGHEPR